MRVQCETCLSPFRIEPRRIGTARFCSRTCQGKGQRSRGYYVCTGCGVSVETNKRRATEALYCNKECMASAKFGAEYEIDAVTGCWNWKRAKTDKGYGKGFRHGETTRFAHILMWTKKNGPVPDGLELDHLCKNRGCVNPDHLEAVTHKENMERADRIVNARRATHCPSGHEWAPENTGRHISGGRACKACANIGRQKRRARIRMPPQ